MSADTDALSFVISWSGLWTYSPADPRTRLQVNQLPADGHGHVHGRLEIAVGGRFLPGLGYWDSDDVCLGDWVAELHKARSALGADGAVHVYDEGEQGQPAYEFRRVGSRVLISVIEGSGGGEADPGWQGIECDLAEFVSATSKFEDELRLTVEGDAGEAGQRWFEFAMRFV